MVVAHSPSTFSRRRSLARATLGLVALAAVPLVAGCASLGPSVQNADNASVDLAHQQIRTSDLQIVQGLLIQPTQLGSGWTASSTVDKTSSGEDALQECGVGIGSTGKQLSQQESYHSENGWLVNQVLVYDNAADATNALGSIGGASTNPSCVTTDAVGKPQPPGTDAAKYVINGASVLPKWYNPAAGLIAPAVGEPGATVEAESPATAVIAQARGPFVSVIYGDADTSDNVPQDASSVTLAGAQAAFQQLNQLTDADVGSGS